MSETSPAAEALPTELAREMERRCDRFEATWQSGTPPRMEDYLAHTPEALRTVLLQELVHLDLHHRQARGERCQPADYQARFPELNPEWLVLAVAGSHAAHAEMAASNPQTLPCENGMGIR
jgi:hypothetical protein